MLLLIVPGGLLLLAAVAAFGPAESVAAAEAFAGLAALAFAVGGLFKFHFARRSSIPSLATLRRFVGEWIRAHPGAPEEEARAALARHFIGSTGVADYGTPQSGNPGDALAGAGFIALAVWMRHRFFPTAPARREDIEAVLGELRADGVFNQK